MVNLSKPASRVQVSQGLEYFYPYPYPTLTLVKYLRVQPTLADH